MVLLKLQFETRCSGSQPLLYSSGPLGLQKLKPQYLLIFCNCCILIATAHLPSQKRISSFLASSFPATQGYDQTVGSCSISQLLDPREPLAQPLACIPYIPPAQPHIPVHQHTSASQSRNNCNDFCVLHLLCNKIKMPPISSWINRAAQQLPLFPFAAS